MRQRHEQKKQRKTAHGQDARATHGRDAHATNNQSTSQPINFSPLAICQKIFIILRAFFFGGVLEL